jgi:lipooligosaccharide transport system permease protein
VIGRGIEVPALRRRYFRGGPVIRRDLRVYRRSWPVLVASLLEPLLYLLSIGIGVGHLIGHVPGLDIGNSTYPVYVGAGLLATAAMNAAFYETSFTVFARLRSERVYDAMVVTPIEPIDIAMGETLWGALRGMIAGGGFVAELALFGLARSPWILLAVPASLVVGFMFSSLGLLAMTFLKDWSHFEVIHVVMLPLFLFSTTFFPLSVYPQFIQAPITWLPLYPSIQLLRGLVLGQVGPGLFPPLVYAVGVGLMALVLASRRLRAIVVG